MRLGLPLVCNLSPSLSALVGVPKLLGMPFAHVIYATPDFGYTLLVSGVVALVWASGAQRSGGGASRGVC